MSDLSCGRSIRSDHVPGDFGFDPLGESPRDKRRRRGSTHAQRLSLGAPATLHAGPKAIRVLSRLLVLSGPLAVAMGSTCHTLARHCDSGLKPENAAELKEMQTKELNNGRLAMLAIAGMVAQEAATGGKLF